MKIPRRSTKYEDTFEFIRFLFDNTDATQLDSAGVRLFDLESKISGFKKEKSLWAVGNLDSEWNRSMVSYFLVDDSSGEFDPVNGVCSGMVSFRFLGAIDVDSLDVCTHKYDPDLRRHHDNGGFVPRDPDRVGDVYCIDYDSGEVSNNRLGYHILVLPISLSPFQGSRENAEVPIFFRKKYPNLSNHLADSSVISNSRGFAICSYPGVSDLRDLRSQRELVELRKSLNYNTMYTPEIMMVRLVSDHFGNTEIIAQLASDNSIEVLDSTGKFQSVVEGSKFMYGVPSIYLVPKVVKVEYITLPPIDLSHVEYPPGYGLFGLGDEYYSAIAGKAFPDRIEICGLSDDYAVLFKRLAVSVKPIKTGRDFKLHFYRKVYHSETKIECKVTYGPESNVKTERVHSTSFRTG